MGFYTVVAILFIGLIIWGMYESKKKSEVELEKIKLERDQIALEQKRLESKKEYIR